MVGFSSVYFAGRRQQSVAPGVVAFSIQVFLGVGFYYTVGLVADDQTYHLAATDLAASLRANETVEAQVGITKASFVWLIGSLYFLLGSHPLVGIIFNALLMGLVPSVIASSCRHFGMREVARTAAWISALAPSFVFWAPWLRREALAFFLLALVVLTMGLLFDRRYVSGILMLTALTSALAVTRAQLVAVALTGAVASVLASRGLTSGRFLIRGSIGALVIVLLAMPLVPQPVYDSVTQPLNASRLPGILGETAGLDQNLRVEGVSAEFNTSPSGIAINLLRTVAGPFPWEWKNFAWIVAGLDGITFLLLALTAVMVLRVCPDRRRQTLVLLVALVPLIVGTALLLGNYGIVMRIRGHFLPFLIPVLALGLRYVWLTRSTSRYSRSSRTASSVS